MSYGEACGLLLALSLLVLMPVIMSAMWVEWTLESKSAMAQDWDDEFYEYRLEMLSESWAHPFTRNWMNYTKDDNRRENVRACIHNRLFPKDRKWKAEGCYKKPRPRLLG